MSWECRYLNGTDCMLRSKPCDPGATGCVLQGKYYFPFDEEKNKKPIKTKKSATNKKY